MSVPFRALRHDACQRILVLGTVKSEVRHVPVTPALEFHNVLGLARRDVVVIVAIPVICHGTKHAINHAVHPSIERADSSAPPSWRTHAM